MKLKKDETVCGLCREIVKTPTITVYIAGYEFSGFSSKTIYGKCCLECAKTKLEKNGEVIGRVLRIKGFKIMNNIIEESDVKIDRKCPKCGASMIKIYGGYIIVCTKCDFEEESIDNWFL